MPQIAQQDYRVISHDMNRPFANDAVALGELKKAILNGIGFDCLINGSIAGENDINRILGFYPDGSGVSYYSAANGEFVDIALPNTITQYQGLAAVQNAVDEKYEAMVELPTLEGNEYLADEKSGCFICVDDKLLNFSLDSDDCLETIVIAETGPTADDKFINITWEDAQKLIGLPISS